MRTEQILALSLSMAAGTSTEALALPITDSTAECATIEALKSKREWSIVKPGVIGLNGTPFEIRYDTLTNARGEVVQENAFVIYQWGKYRSFATTLGLAKDDAERMAKELEEIGLRTAE